MCLTWGGRPAHSCRRLAIQRDTYHIQVSVTTSHGRWHGPSFFVVDMLCCGCARKEDDWPPFKKFSKV